MTRPMSEEREKLEPCPFCGGPAELSQYNAEPGLWWRVECLSCCAKSPGAKFPALAVAAWNRRSTSAPERGLREALANAAVDLECIADYLGATDGIKAVASTGAREARAALSGIEPGDEQARGQGRSESTD